jgi:D-alanine-D-alanine ligase
LSVALGVRLGPLLAEHRETLDGIVRATGVFSDDEVTVALELFDETFGKSAVVNRKSNGDDLRFPMSDYEFIGAFEDDRLIGYACFGSTPSTDNTYDLYWIAVHPDAQRSGAGSVLMSEVEHRLHARRARLLVVETSSRADYSPTRRFYEKRGYEQSARIENFYAHGDHRVIFTKHLGR